MTTNALIVHQNQVNLNSFSQQYIAVRELGSTWRQAADTGAPCARNGAQ